MENSKAIGILQAVKAGTADIFISKAAINDALDMAIAALEQQGEDNEWCLDCKEYDKEQHCCHRFTKVIRQAVEEHRREWPGSKWIPATENPKKPKYQFDTYLVYTKYERFGVADYFIDGSWIGYDIDGDQIDGDEIIAWRLLPKPPYQEDRK